MPLDRYLPCPGGTGKKIKFCCTDLFGELEQIQRMLEGEQRLACLEHVGKTLAAHPDRPCLLAIKCLLEAELDQAEQLKQTLASFQQKHPNNPVMLAELALDRAETEEPRSGVVPLQQAIAAVVAEMPTRVYEAIGLLGRLLLGRGWIMAGRAHLMLQAAIAGANDTSAMSMLLRLNRAADVPLLLKQEYRLELPPEEITPKDDFRAALDLAMRGAWLAAADRFAALARGADRVPAVWHNQAVLRAWLADHAAAVVALRTLAKLEIPEDDAIEAEALAQLLDIERDLLDVVAATYAIEGAAEVQARLLADRRASNLSVNLSELAEEGQPPPLGAFRLLDRPLPESGAALTRESVPRVLAQLFVFGKQTDRPARLELIVARGPDFDAAREVLAAIIGREPGPSESEDVVRQIPAVQHALGTQWQLPADTPLQDRVALVRAEHEHVILEKWASLASPLLDGKTPNEVAADATYRVRLAAAVLNLEQSGGSSGENELFNKLRSRLGLPVPPPIEPGDLDIDALPMIRLARLNAASLSDEQLVQAYRQAALYHVAPALARLAAEVVARPSLDKSVDKAEAYGLLAEVTEDAGQRLKYIDQARRIAEARGDSSAPWDLAELAVHLEQGRITDVDRLVQHLRTHHVREPGVAQALMELFYRMGLVDPDGRPRAQAAMPASTGAGASLVAPGEEVAPASKLWTPGSAAPSGSAKKPVIWTPGSG